MEAALSEGVVETILTFAPAVLGALIAFIVIVPGTKVIAPLIRRRKEGRLSVGDHVRTLSGLYGEITGVGDDYVDITHDGATESYLKSVVDQVISR